MAVERLMPSVVEDSAFSSTLTATDEEANDVTFSRLAEVHVLHDYFNRWRRCSTNCYHECCCNLVDVRVGAQDM